MDVKSGNSVSLKKKREDILNSSERNILRRIFGRARERERERKRVGCGNKINEEFYINFKGLNIHKKNKRDTAWHYVYL